MKKLLLSIAVLTFGTSVAMAQCTPDVTAPAPNYADSTFGAWPDTTTNFANGAVGVPYTQELQFKVPLDAGDVDPLLAGSDIESFTVDAVNGLPPGLSYACNISNCEFLGGTVGCALLSGTPTTAGTYEVEIEVTGVISIFGFPANAPYTFVGYEIVIGAAGEVELVYNPFKVVPNPANDKINIQGLSKFNVTGIEITNMDATGLASMEVSLDGFANGIYFVNVNHSNGKEVVKFIKE
jgi:hypothetical protein